MKERVIEGVVHNLSSSGKGIVRTDGKVAFVPFVIEGESVRARVVKEAKNFSEAELMEIVKPSSARREPACVYFGRCGGCQLQHMDYAVQLSAKTKMVEDALSRIGGFSQIGVQSHGTDLRFSYRRHVRLHVVYEQAKLQLGYIDLQGRLLEVEHCPIFSEDKALFKAIKSFLSSLGTLREGTKGSCVLMKAEAGRYLLSLRLKALPRGLSRQHVQALLQTQPFLKGVRLEDEARSFEAGDCTGVIEVDAQEFTYDLRAFLQVHPTVSAQIYQRICDHVQAIKATRLVDLYCGIGVSSILLAKQGVKVIGAELNKAAVKMARDNAQGHGVKDVEFHAIAAEDGIEQLLKTPCDALLLNPPREGADKRVVETLLEKGPPTLLYVSCDPATLARDMKLLKQRYRVTSVELFDMFPQTMHVETLLCAVRHS